MGTLAVVGNAFGTWLRSRRDERGLTVRALAKLIGVTHTFEHMMETGDRELPLTMRKPLADALGVPVEDILRATFPDRFQDEAERELLKQWLSEGAPSDPGDQG